ncbi:MAG: S9 family peptidase [Wenyingzhuangia sp.]
MSQLLILVMITKSSVLFFLSVFCSVMVTAQNKHISLDEIWSGAFRTKQMNTFHSLKNDKEYTMLSWNSSTRSTSIDLYDYKTQEKKRRLVDSSLIGVVPFFDYSFSKNEDKLLLATEIKPIYRRSFSAKYYLYNLQENTKISIDERQIQNPTFSPEGNKIAYVFDCNIYIKNLDNNITTQITFDGKKNKIINGITDWVYEEEFEFVRAFEWSKSGTYLAYLKFDESNVPEVSMNIYGQHLYPKQQSFKYPKAGQNNSVVSLHTYQLSRNETNTVWLPNDSYYIPRIKFTQEEGLLSVQTLNRHQNNLNLYFCDVHSKQLNLVINEQSERYVELMNQVMFIENNSFFWRSEQDGFNHIYLYSKSGKLQNQITSGNWEVTDFYGYNKKDNTIYYQSTEDGSTNRAVYQIDLNSKNKKKLSTSVGTNSAVFSPRYTYSINTFSSVTVPPRVSLKTVQKTTEIKELMNNNELLKKLDDYALSNKVFSKIKVNDNLLNMWMIKPIGFDEQKKYPVLMYQYSGPGSQEVANRWNNVNDYWFQLLASRGYIVVCIDGRGTGFKGAEFKKVTYKQLGKYEVEDQIQAAKQLGLLSYVDKSRIGIWGWSYGGFMSTNCLLKGNDVFKMAIAVAPVTSWRFYDTIYTERYMQTPQENPKGYDLNSPLYYADQLKGSFLLIHGAADDNVHLQNTMALITELVNKNKQFDWAIYPDKDHGIYGGNTRLQLYQKMTNFIEESL